MSKTEDASLVVPEIIDPAALVIHNLNPAQVEILTGRTPPEFIRQKPGRGGQMLSYIPVGYVRNRLNMAFGLDWDWEIIGEQMMEDQITVRGKLTVRVAGHTIIKNGDGGAPIQRYSQGPNAGKIIDLGDDKKSASSDALKVAARLLGIGADLAWLEEAELERYADEQRTEEARRPRPSPPPPPRHERERVVDAEDRDDNGSEFEMRKVAREITLEMNALTSDKEIQAQISRELLAMLPNAKGQLPTSAASLDLGQRRVFLAGLKQIGPGILERIREDQSKGEE